MARLRASMTQSFGGPAAHPEPPPEQRRLLRAPPLVGRLARETHADTPQAPPAAVPGLGPSAAQDIRHPPAAPAGPRPRPTPPEEDLLADLPPAQVPLRITVSPLPLAAAAAKPAPEAAGTRAPAAERAFRTGRQGARPAHAMSAAEVAAWREGAMEAGRARDPIVGLPRLWWWLALSLTLLLPLAYAASWLGLPGSGTQFLTTPLGQEAWILTGGPQARWFYWGAVMIVALLAQVLRPLEPVLILGAAAWWGWTGLHAAWLAGWVAQRIPPLPLPG